MAQAVEASGPRYIREALLGLCFGAITIIVQDGVIIQVERTERKRWDGKRQSR